MKKTHIGLTSSKTEIKGKGTKQCTLLFLYVTVKLRLIGSILPTEIALKKNFDKNGTRR